jgi:hypothetical protein
LFSGFWEQILQSVYVSPCVATDVCSISQVNWKGLMGLI